jgi:hypothetical protein
LRRGGTKLRHTTLLVDLTLAGTNVNAVLDVELCMKLLLLRERSINSAAFHSAALAP